MLSLIKKLFGAKESEPTPVPYKVETPTIQDAPVEGTVTKEAVQKAVKAAKKPAVKKATTRKPKAPKA
jgi:ribosomal protein L21